MFIIKYKEVTSSNICILRNQYFGAGSMMQWDKPQPTVPASPIGNSSSPRGSTSQPALYYKPGKVVENDFSAWAPEATWETMKKLLTPGCSLAHPCLCSHLGNEPARRHTSLPLCLSVTNCLLNK